MRAIPFIFFGVLFLMAAYAAWHARSKKKSIRRSHYKAMEESRQEAYNALAEIEQTIQHAQSVGTTSHSEAVTYSIVLDTIRKTNNKELNA